jgi:hypothetical protein
MLTAPESKPQDCTPVTLPPPALEICAPTVFRSSQVQVASSGSATLYCASRSVFTTTAYAARPVGIAYSLPSTLPVSSAPASKSAVLRCLPAAPRSSRAPRSAYEER